MYSEKGNLCELELADTDTRNASHVNANCSVDALSLYPSVGCFSDVCCGALIYWPFHLYLPPVVL